VRSEPKVASDGVASFLFQLESIEFEGLTRPTSASLFVHWRGNPSMGDELRLFGIAEMIAPPRNPGEFDMRSYLARRDVRRSLFVRYVEDGVLLSKRGGNPVLRAAQKSRDWMQGVICHGLEDSPQVQNFLSGIALGLRHQTPEDIEEPFQQTGTLHLFAVAGLHVGIVARLLWTIATVARLPRRAATAVVIPLLLFYAAVTGLHVSSVRAAIMASLILAGFLFERRGFVLNSLAAAAFVLLCWDTNQLFASGFQLSFAVVGAIALLADRLSTWSQQFGGTDSFLPQRLVSRPRRALGQAYHWACRGASVSFAAWVGSLPLVFWYFHLITPSSLVANLVVVPIAFFILAIALLSLLTAPFSSTLSLLFNNANWSLANAIFAFVHFVAETPGSHYYVPSLRWPDPAVVRISVLDLGAGAGAHIHVSGANWLIDCGNARNYDRVVRPYLHFSGVNRIEGLILTHGDSLHIGGAESLLEDFSPRHLFDNPAPDRSMIHRRLREIFLKRQLPTEWEPVFTMGPDVNAKILFPPRDFSAGKSDDQALVIQLAIRSARLLFMSDAGVATENWLLQRGNELRSDILVKGQHHSGNSGSDALLNAVQPRLIIATSRDFPQQERISDEWAERVRARGIKLFRQDETGAVELELGKANWQARAYLSGEVFRSDNR
ncbi:MAG TPA: ComEC/Rec2 family competence protein, partial [Chthoniobacterales bacterium]|nr:ComEC/Rec2 family competence protein [Chthoniobacterales bacterium]